jgi:type IV pilus assembly protein PilQ
LSAQVDGAAAGGPPTIRAVRFHVEPGQTRVWFETTGAVLYTHYSPDPLTLVIDLPGVDIGSLAPRTVVGSREVESVLATSLPGANGKKLSRLEIKLATIAPYQISGSEHALNVVFDGGDAPEGPAPGAQAAPASTSPETLVAGAPAPKARPSVAASSTERAASPAPSGDEIREETIEPPKAAKPAKGVPEKPVKPLKTVASRPASAINAITHEIEGGVLRVNLVADGRLNYTSFKLDSPRRLVFDFNGVLNAVSRAAQTIDELGVARVRVAQFRTTDPKITRVVFDLDEDVTHRALAEDSGLQIDFARSSDQFQSPALGSIDDTPQEPAPATDVPGTIVIESDAGASVHGVIKDAAYTPSEGGSIGPVTLTAQDLSSFARPAPALPTPPPPAQEPTTPSAPAPGTETVVLPGSQQLGERQYTGELISLDFKDGDIQDIFRLFADISGLNIVVQPGVTGRITLKLVEVPWDQALELILKTNKLGYAVEGNVIRIAPLAELAAEEADRRKLAEEKALAGELFTQTRVLSYAKASEIQPLLQKNLSARGDIVIDERTNTVIYTDLAEEIQAINTLIDTLDTPIPGVEIEARIIVTTRTFARQLGVQWGFTSNQTQALGNTTELVFPNRIQLDGQAVGSTAANQFRGEPPEGGLQAPTTLVGTTTAQRGYAVNLPFAGAPTGAIGLSLGSITGAFSIDAAISAAERRGQVRIISAPKIITQNNKAAEIKQGVTFPVQVVANNTITVQFKDAVLDLTVTPQITSADTIILDLKVNNDSLDFGRAVNGIPSIITQAATTQVLVDDGSTTVIGGVFVNTQNESENYVPLLHRIPLLGYLFKNKSTDTRNEELLIFLTPRIRKETV